MDKLKADILAVNSIAAIPKILEVICHTTGMGFAAVARVTEDRWIACNVLDNIGFGLKPGGELKIDTTICDEIRQNRKAVIIEHVAEDETYCSHLTPAMYGFQSYISIPLILSDGQFFGTLCAIDPRPMYINKPETVNMFMLFAELIAFHLNAIEQLISTNAMLLEERTTSALREQFIAVLGHDLRNPLNAISLVASQLAKMNINTRVFDMATLIQTCGVRMSKLIDNIMDFARGRLGGGITLERNNDEPLEPVLKHVIAEIQASWPQRKIETYFSAIPLVFCDHRRIAQLFSNLLSNALTYGSKEEPVRVQIISNEEIFELAVSNAAIPIPTTVLKRLFQPFYRGEGKSNQQGLGLGLYIAAEIARAHGGELNVISQPEETRFTLQIPISQKSKT